MKKRSRLTRRSDFERLLRARSLYSGEAMVGFAAPGRGPGTRVGVSTSRKIKGSVARNRARRRLREAVRLALVSEGSTGGEAGISFDIVLIARPPALSVSFTRLRSELGRFLARLAAAPAAGPG